MDVLERIFPQGCVLGDPITTGGLGMVPIIISGGGHRVRMPAIDLLDDALEQNDVQVSEVSDKGDVPFLFLDNGSLNHVLVLNGMELIGGKQNRICNTDIIAPRGRKIRIPVSCVERRRWHYNQPHFTTSGALFRSSSRSLLNRSVSNTVRFRNQFLSNQHAVWSQVDRSLEEFSTKSRTADFQAVRENVKSRVDAIVNGLQPVRSQIGAIFVLEDGDILGAEILGSTELFAKSIAKIVKGFALDAINAKEIKTVDNASVLKWWEKLLASPIQKHRSVGPGTDIRIDLKDITAAGLTFNCNLIHLAAFPIANPAL